MLKNPPTLLENVGVETSTLLSEVILILSVYLLYLHRVRDRGGLLTKGFTYSFHLVK